MKYKIKKNDHVIVIAGDDKGKKGKVLNVFPKSSTILVDGINVIKKSQKITESNDQNFKLITKSVHISNVKIDKKDNIKVTKSVKKSV